MTTVVSVGKKLDLKQDPSSQTQIELHDIADDFIYISKEDAAVLIPLLQKFVETGKI